MSSASGCCLPLPLHAHHKSGSCSPALLACVYMPYPPTIPMCTAALARKHHCPCQHHHASPPMPQYEHPTAPHLQHSSCCPLHATYAPRHLLTCVACCLLLCRPPLSTAHASLRPTATPYVQQQHQQQQQVSVGSWLRLYGRQRMAQVWQDSAGATSVYPTATVYLGAPHS
jgi:hypothetical protein